MEEKKTRRNKRILIVSAMLVLLIGILCFGGVTFAKYITSKDTGTQQATVAKWGYVVTADTTKLFGDAYKAEEVTPATDPKTYVSKVTADKTGQVSILSTANVIAPGAKGELVITINGTAEVSSKLTVADPATDGYAIKEISLVDGSTTYKPVKWTLTEKTSGAVSTDGTLTDCIAKLKAIGTSKRAGESVALEYTLAYEWKFENTEVKANEYDTVLGDAMGLDKTKFDAKWATGGTEGTAYDYDTVKENTTISFGLIISVEQTQDNV